MCDVRQEYLSELSSRDVNDEYLVDDLNLYFPNMFPPLVRLDQEQMKISTLTTSDRRHRSPKSDYFVRTRVSDYRELV